MIVLSILASMASLLSGEPKFTYQSAQPIAEVKRCILLNSNRETREVIDGDRVMIGFAALTRFYAVASLSQAAAGTRVEVRGNGLTSEEKACVSQA